MTEIKLGRWLAIALLLAATGTVPRHAFSGVQGDSQEGMPTGYARLTTLESEVGSSQATSLIVVAWYEDRRIQRLLINTPTGEHLVLTESEFPLEGIMRLELLVEGTGWAAVLEERSGLKFDNVLETADPAAFAAKFVQTEHPRTVVLKAPGLKSEFEHSSTTWDDRFSDDLFLLLSAQLEAQSLVQAMEPPTREAVRFLDSLTSCGECSVSLGKMSFLVEILARALEEERAQDEVAEIGQELWGAKPVLTAREGADLSPEVLQFLEEFRSVPETDVLADLRPAADGRPRE